MGSVAAICEHRQLKNIIAHPVHVLRVETCLNHHVHDFWCHRRALSSVEKGGVSDVVPLSRVNAEVDVIRDDLLVNFCTAA